jgi:hypothetical protein
MAALIAAGRPGQASITDTRSAGKRDAFRDALSAGWRLYTLSGNLRYLSGILAPAASAVGVLLAPTGLGRGARLILADGDVGGYAQP